MADGGRSHIGMRSRDLVAYLESALENLQHELLARFTALRDDRGGAPVYALEHGFDADRLSMVRHAVGDAVRRNGIGAWWHDRPLPLLVVATEVGYGYRGTGTDFWPTLCAALSAELSFADHVRLSELFERAHAVLRLKKPADTPWNRLFHHIAWPISNAVAPLEIHRSLALALQRVFQSPPSSLEAPQLAEALGAAARALGSPRLEDWCADHSLSGALCRRLMRLDHDDVVAPDLMERIWRDLSADTIARRAMRLAMREQRGRVRTSRTSAGPPTQAVLQLLSAGSGAPRLALSAPFTDLSDAHRRLARGVSLAPWKGAEPIGLEDLLCGRSQVLSLASLPGAKDDFLAGAAEAVGDHALGDRLMSARPELVLPLVFVGTSEVARQVRERSLSPADEAWLVANDFTDLPPSVAFAGKLGSAACIHVPDPSRAGDWLARQGINVRNLTRLQPVAAVVVGQAPTGPVIAPGMPAIFRLSGSQTATVNVGGGEADISLQPSTPYLVVQAGSGEHELAVDVEGRSSPLSWVCGSESRDPEPPLEIALDPARPSLEMLRRGEVAIHLRTSLSLVPRTVTLSLVAGENVLATSRAYGVQLPILLAAGEGVLDELVRALDEIDVPSAGSVWLTADVEGLCREWWPLGREIRPVVWERHDQSWRPRLDEEILEVTGLSADHPLEEPDTASAEEVEALRLLLPVANGRLVEEGGFVLGPRRLTIGGHAAIAGRLGRSWHGIVGSSARSVCLNYLRWSWAEARNPVLEVGRRRVAASLEAASVVQFCGENWARIEARHGSAPPDCWTALAQTAVARGLAAGGDFPELRGWQQGAFVRHLAQRIARTVPDLWGAGEITDAVAESLDVAMGEAWEDLFEEIFRRDGQFVLADIDPGNSAADWTNALGMARDRVRVSDLLTYVLPRSRATALSTPDYQDLSLDEVGDILVRDHVDLSVRGQTRWIADEDLRRALLFWARTAALAADPDWMSTMQRLLSDRQTARAVRYAALRYRASRGQRG